MRLFFDANTSPVLAETIGAYVRHLGHTAHHISTLPCGRHASDLEWMALLAQHQDWIVITGDLRIARNKAERAAYVRARLCGFALSPGLLKGMKLNQVAAALLLRWPQMEQFIRLSDPALYEIQVNGRFKPLL